ncbi:hypothetical protein AMATHDRAFT_64113 [Amanita thiersii Skay4041]|uniref:Uncharacterized protein n=1 Tax=Amanita thiersii Skay4041 TaxID=703135 RepID=A0A2A9NMM8_9AGAR|nr:hypothetical protein AMATHDRAFT_64113 [Amanita thiersii Skay4041]
MKRLGKWASLQAIVKRMSVLKSLEKQNQRQVMVGGWGRSKTEDSAWLSGILVIIIKIPSLQVFVLGFGFWAAIWAFCGCSVSENL